jgi:stalled ribosome alternative rescue factor ArfA
MSEQCTKSWMRRNKLKAVSVYLRQPIFERVEAAAQQDGRSKGSWIRKLVIEALRKSGPHDH